MKKLITLFALLTLFAIGAQAQMVGANEGSKGSNQNTYSNSDLYQQGQRNIKTGNIIFLSATGVGITAGIIILGVIGAEEYVFLAGPVFGVVIGGAVAAPFWITGANRKKRAKNMAYVPLLQQDIPINDNLTFTPSIGITNYQGLSPEMNRLQTNALSVGFSLNF